MKHIASFLLLLLAAGCVSLPAPHIHPPTAYLHAALSRSDSLPYDIAWWSCFNDSLLNRLEWEALRCNYDLAQAATRVEAARENRRSILADYRPHLDLQAEAEAGYTAPQGITQKYSLSPTMSWELPLFGALKASRNLAEANIQESEWAFRGVVLSLTAEVATTYFTLIGYQQSLDIATRTHRLRYEAFALTDSLLRYGMTTAIARDQAYSLLLTAASDQAEYERMVEQTYLSLLILLGQSPKPLPDSFNKKFDPVLSTIVEIPVGLPSELLHRRPDVMEAFYGLEAAAAQVGLARAARFPSISLTAEGGVAAEFIRGVKAGQPWFWNAVASVTGPLVEFGKRKAAEEVAREQYLEKLFAYEASFLQALSDVEQALVGIETLDRELSELTRLVEVNGRIAKMNWALYRNGMSAYLDVLDAERSYYAAQLQWVELQVSRLTASVDLFKALGGGW